MAALNDETSQIIKNDFNLPKFLLGHEVRSVNFSRKKKRSRNDSPTPTPINPSNCNNVTVVGQKISSKKLNTICNSHGESWIRTGFLGKGGYGCVFLARKLNSSNCSQIPAEIAVKSAFIERSSSLQFEKKVLLQLSRSPNIVQCYGDEITQTKSSAAITGTGIGSRSVYNILLEYCSGHSLKKHILKNKGLPELEVRRYTRDIVSGLICIHGSQYIHCDLKPENILLSPSSSSSITETDRLVAKIADFGMAKSMRSPVMGNKMRGTKLYLSPELVRDGHLDWTTDIWALGCLVLEMFTGKQVWSGFEETNNDTECLLTRIGHSDELPEIPDGLSKMAKQFLATCLVKDPYQRKPASLLLTHPFLSL